jgi:hypothetical protein
MVPALFYTRIATFPLVGQVANLRRIVNPPAASTPN